MNSSVRFLWPAYGPEAWSRIAVAVFALVLVQQWRTTAAGQYPFHLDDSQIVITRGDRVLGTLPCERVSLDGKGLWTRLHDVAYIRAHVARTSDGKLYVHGGGAYGAYWVVESCDDVFFVSEDDGRTWSEGWHVDLPDKRMIGTFTVLADDSFLAMATQPSGDVASFYRSADRGKTWTLVSEIHAAPFKTLSVDGNLLQLQDGSIIVPTHFSVKAPEGTYWGLNLTGQFVMRSADGGKTWAGGPDPEVWKPLIDAKLTVAPVGPDSRVPGGTFPGCYETGVAQEQSGRLIAALRFSGPQHPWHKTIMKEWGGRPADGVGRIFRQVMFSESSDGGKNWATMRPFFDAQGQPVIIQQETNGQLVPLGDGRIALVHQRRFGPFQIVVRFSVDAGKTWLHDEYRLNKGFGFTTSVLLDDGTIVTATGQSVSGAEDQCVSVIRWKPPSKDELLANAKSGGLPPPEFVDPIPGGLSLLGVGGLDADLDVTKFHTYKMRLQRADPKSLSGEDRVEVFVDDRKVGEAHRRQLPFSGERQLIFGDNDSSSPDDIASSMQFTDVTLMPGDGTSAGAPKALKYSAAAADPSPESQGWTEVVSGAGGEAHIERDGDKASWHIATKPRGKVTYSRPIDPALYADPQGWTLTVRCRVVDRANPGSCNVMVRDDRSTFGLALGK